MAYTLHLLAVLSITSVVFAAPKVHDKQHSCQDFTQGVTFNDTQSYGSWHLLHYKTEKTNGSGDPHCVRFSPVTDEERNNLNKVIGKYVENLKWDKLSLKMQIPCEGVIANRTRDYYLEQLEGEGSFRTLQMPPPTAKLDLAEFHRYPMRLKVIEGEYLGMMDCHERIVFLFGRQPAQGELDERLKKMIDGYWQDDE